MEKLISMLLTFGSGLGSRKIAGLILMASSLFGKNLPPEIFNEDVLAQIVGFVGLLLTMFGNGAKANMSDVAEQMIKDAEAAKAVKVTKQTVEVPEGSRVMIVPMTGA